MSYTRRPEALGLSWSDVTGAIQKGINYAQQGVDIAKAAPGIIDATKGIIEDPYLKETACNLARLKAVTAGQYPGPPCPPTAQPVDPRKGIGLKAAITPIKIATFAKSNPWAVPLALGAIVGIPLYLAYRVGKGRRK